MEVEPLPVDMQALARASHICDVVDAHAADDPERLFLVLIKDGAEARLSYRELADRARHFSAAYRARGLRRGAVIVIMLVTHADLAPGFLGAMRAGMVPTLFPAISVKQDPAVFWPSQRGAFERLDVGLIVTEAALLGSLAEHLPELADRALAIEAIGACGPGPARSEPVETAPRGIAFLQHSSGTTGIKKGVALTHRAVLDAVAALGAVLGIAGRDVVASWLPLYHDMGLIGALMLPMLAGITIAELDPFDWAVHPLSLLDCIETHRATICWMPNFAFHHILRSTRPDRRWDLSCLRTLIDAGEPCKPETLALFEARFASNGLRPGAIRVAYGMAENVLLATITDPGRPPRAIELDRDSLAERQQVAAPAGEAAVTRILSVGRPLPGTSVRILDRYGQPAGERCVGEIAVASAYLFSGYHRMEVTPTLSDGWYRTGDLGFLDDGELFCCGRVDDLLIVNGRNFYAHDLEFTANRVAGVRPGRVVAVAPFNPRTGSRALVVIAEADDPDPAARISLKRAISARLQGEFGLAPYDILVTDPGWLVKTTSGKIGRGINEQRYLARFPQLGS